jgi:hypothetical protein
MNAIAASPGWRSLAIWAMPPIAYALASDTLIGVVRAWAIARDQALSSALADDGGVTPLALAGGLVLWMLRLTLAPVSTLAGFRAWVVEECPVAPGRRLRTAPELTSPVAPKAATRRRPAKGPRTGTKTARFLALATEQHGPLAAIPVDQVGRISAGLAPQVGLNAGAARAALRKAILAAQDGDPR